MKTCGTEVVNTEIEGIRVRDMIKVKYTWIMGLFYHKEVANNVYVNIKKFSSIKNNY